MNLFKYIPYFTELPTEAQVAIILISAPILIWLTVVVIRRIVSRFILRPIEHYVKNTETDLDDRALLTIERPIRVLVIGVAIAVISTFFQFTGDLDQLTDNLAKALIIASIFYFIYNLVDVVGVTSENLNRFTGLTIEERLLPFLRVVTKTFVVIMGGLIIVQEFGYSITGLVASFGVVGLAISLAAQDTAANVIGFTSIVSDNPFEVGDYIITSDIAGIVEEVGVRTTRIRKLDQSLVTIPNNTITGAAVTNWSRLAKRRLDFYIGVTYSTNASQMRELLHQLRDMLQARDTVDPESVIVNFVEFGDSALKIRVIAYVMIPDWGEFTAEQELINLEIMEIVENQRLSMAFPSTSVYIESFPQPGTEQPDMAKPTRHVQQTDRTHNVARPVEQGKAEASYQENPTVSSGDDGDNGEES